MSTDATSIIIDTYQEARDAAIRRCTIDKACSPVIAVRCVHRFRYLADSFPAGHPLPDGYIVAARWRPTASGRGRWERYDESYED